MIRVLLVDDETVVRTAVAQLLDLEDDLDVVAQAADGREAIDRARVTHPDVAVLDPQMPGLDGIEATRALLREQPSLVCVILTSHARAGHLQRALEAGDRGFLPKTASPEAVAETIRTVATSNRHEAAAKARRLGWL